MATPRNQIGFECEFVEDPPQWLQTECPICLQILPEPYQVTCCGKSFCRQCMYSEGQKVTTSLALAVNKIILMITPTRGSNSHSMDSKSTVSTKKMVVNGWEN